MNALAATFANPDDSLDRVTCDPAAFRKLTASFIAEVAKLEPTTDEEKLKPLRSLRSQIAEALLAATPPLDPDLASSAKAAANVCMTSGLRNFARLPREEELFSRCVTAATSAPPEEAVAYWIAAVMMASHAFELPNLPPLSDIPESVRATWLSFLLESPPAFAQSGDAEKFISYLQQICDLLLQHLRSTVGPADDVVTAFLSSNIFLQSYFNELNLRGLMTKRAAIIEDILTRRGATLDQLRVMRPCRHKPTIGFIVYSAGDGTETTGLAAFLERLDRRRFEIKLYSLVEPAGKMGALCRAAAESYLKLSENIPEAVARLRGEALDIAFFCTNLTATAHSLTQIAAHRVAPIQTTTLTSATTTGLRNMDVIISGAPNETDSSPAHYTERLVCADGVINCAPFHYMIEGLPTPEPVTRSDNGIPDDSVLFFSAANFYKILPELSETWFRILAEVPNSYLMLMPFNPNWSNNYPVVAFNARLREQAAAVGVALDRLRMHLPVQTIAHLYRIMEMADIYLDAFPYSGACSISDALTVGLPVVSNDGLVFRSRQSRAILEDAGLGDWTCSDEKSYVRRAIALAHDPALRRKERERLDKICQAGLKLKDTAPYALMMMRTYDGVVADWNARVEALHAIAPGEMAQNISDLAAATARRGAVFTDRDLILQVVLPYLRNGGTRRLLDVGAGTGEMTKPFLDEGWQAVMFEPDGRCQKQLAAVLDSHPGQARVEKAAVTADRDGIVQFHVAVAPELSGLSPSPFAADVQTIDVPALPLAGYIAKKGLFDLDFIKLEAGGQDFTILNGVDFKAVTPRLVMASFSDQFADQDRSAIERALQDMRSRGYRACVVCFGILPPFQRHDWPKKLLAIGVDAVPQLPPDAPLFGNILFFRDNDHDVLPSLYDWLEQPFDWEQRSSIQA